MIIIARAHQCGAVVINEWPKACAYWKNPQVIRAIGDYYTTEVHGCAMGLRSINRKDFGLLIKKPWRLDCSDEDFLEPMSTCRCENMETHDHAKCEGKNTTYSEGYTDEMARLVHLCFYEHVRKLVHKVKNPQLNKTLLLAALLMTKCLLVLLSSYP